ncbi:MAG: 4-hydroxy-3-methylbut-2-enyl diphosphate reductase, partial [Fimbriimonadales bacterium]
ILHNEHVVRSFERRGVIFVEDLSEVPEGATVVFSAHGVSPAVRQQAQERNLNVVDATCPLVSKVHREITRFARGGYHILYIGHRGHVEAQGSTGHAPDRITLIDNLEEAETVEVPTDRPLAVATQTTLSVDEVNTILTVLKRRFPQLEQPKKEDICYATTNRQTAVKQLAQQSDLVLVVGSQTSSNSNRLREVAEACGVPAYLLLEPSEVRSEWVQQARVIGITSGASTPESSTEAIVGELLRLSPNATVETLKVLDESVEFIPPRTLIAQAQQAQKTRS